MSAEQTSYHAYLLRLWLASSDPTGSAIWRASLEDPHTGERFGFASLEQLFAYLMALTEATRQSAPMPTGDATGSLPLQKSL